MVGGGGAGQRARLRWARWVLVRREAPGDRRWGGDKAWRTVLRLSHIQAVAELAASLTEDVYARLG